MVYRTLIEPEVLEAHLSDPSWVAVDCRFSLVAPDAGARAYAAGHIPGAHYAHLERDLSAPVGPDTGRHPLPDAASLARTLGRWGVGPAAQVVVYDQAPGAMAARLWWLLRWWGHEAVAVLNGGWERWQREVRSVDSAVPVLHEGRYDGAPHRRAWVDAAELQQGLADWRLLLIDARDAERFRGRVEPIDAVAGHVPGALNRPFLCNLDGQGGWRASEHLRREFRQLVGEAEPSEVVHICGSGVTACHNLLAMEVAGLGGSRLYPGSWSEWIRDPARAVDRD